MAWDTESCSSCWYFQTTNDPVGKCLRYPPQFLQGAGTVADFPRVHKTNDKCGEWTIIPVV